MTQEDDRTWALVLQPVETSYWNSNFPTQSAYGYRMGTCCDFMGSQVSILALAYVLSHEWNYFHHWFHFSFFFPSDFLSWITLGWSQGNFRRRKWGNTYFLWILDSSNIKTIFISIDTVTIKVLKLQWQNEKRNGHS